METDRAVTSPVGNILLVSLVIVLVGTVAVAIFAISGDADQIVQRAAEIIDTGTTIVSPPS